MQLAEKEKRRRDRQYKRMSVGWAEGGKRSCEKRGKDRKKGNEMVMVAKGDWEQGLSIYVKKDFLGVRYQFIH